MMRRVKTSSDDDDQWIWDSSASIEEMIDNVSNLFDRKLDDFPTHSFGEIKDSNSISSSKGTSLDSAFFLRRANL